MNYKHPTIKFEFHQSAFEQVQPSYCINAVNFKYGQAGEKTLSDSEKLRFIEMIKYKIMKLEYEINHKIMDK